MVRKEWIVRALGRHIDLQLVAPAEIDPAIRAETRRSLAQVGYDFRSGDRDARRVVLEICATLGAGSLDSLQKRTQQLDVGSDRWEWFMDVLMRAADTGALVARRHVFQPATLLHIDAPAESVLGPAPEEPEADVYMLAAEVKLIGDTPLINHAVRVLDPDTGEVVAECMTDDKGIVRTEVAAKKKYRIEIVDHDPDRHHFRTISVPHPMLRCAFVDLAGSPVPHLDVIVKDLDGNETDHTTDDKGLLEMPATLRLYEVVVAPGAPFRDDESHWVHSLLHSDGADDAYEIVVSAKLEDGGDGIDPDDRLTRSWEYDDADGDEDADGDLA